MKWGEVWWKNYKGPISNRSLCAMIYALFIYSIKLKCFIETELELRDKTINMKMSLHSRIEDRQ